MAGNKVYQEIFKDDDILVVNKAAGIPVIPGRNLKVTSLIEHLKAHYKQEIFINHRIDRFTSGIVLFALSSEAHKFINEQFLNNKVNKYYQCISVGKVKEGKNTIDRPIFIDPRVQKVSIKPKGKKSLSIYEGLESAGQFHKIEVKIETGRTHQVRVHMASESLPILGDQMYNKRPDYFLKDIKKKYTESKNREERPIISRQALHAYSLEILHPTTGDSQKFIAEWPKDMKACWSMLSKYS